MKASATTVVPTNALPNADDHALVVDAVDRQAGEPTQRAEIRGGVGVGVIDGEMGTVDTDRAGHDAVVVDAAARLEVGLDRMGAHRAGIAADAGTWVVQTVTTTATTPIVAVVPVGPPAAAWRRG